MDVFVAYFIIFHKHPQQNLHKKRVDFKMIQGFSLFLSTWRTIVKTNGYTTRKLSIYGLTYYKDHF